jgi:hypothetical protein
LTAGKKREKEKEEMKEDGWEEPCKDSRLPEILKRNQKRKYRYNHRYYSILD